MTNCPLCDEQASYDPATSLTFKLTCPRCGTFSYTHQATLALNDERRPYLSIYTRMNTEAGITPEVLKTANLDDLANTYRHTGVLQKIDYLLKFLERNTHFFDQPVDYDPRLDWPAIAAVNDKEASGLMGAAVDLGYIRLKSDTIRPQRNLALAVQGWERLGGGPSPEVSGRCFIAMSFDPSLDQAFANGIRPAIDDDLGYEVVRVDKIHHNEKICDKILAEIRRAQFLVADVTKQRQGVYFEAGFAMALGRPVIWSCKQNDFPNVHFDTRQYNHIVWDNPGDLRDKLRERVLASIGARKRN
jgi:hypothetical protein